MGAAPGPLPRILSPGESPWSYRDDPGELSGPYTGPDVETILDEVARDTGEAALGSSSARWWECGDVLWVAPKPEAEQPED